ncbi:MAG: hypothetical protein DME69_08330 [Verrucomicrobia bacterium]|nr:MAG: hypothetical protein DME69_08330 [Verrucomicrobiota bacterium]
MSILFLIFFRKIWASWPFAFGDEVPLKVQCTGVGQGFLKDFLDFFTKTPENHRLPTFARGYGRRGRVGAVAESNALPGLGMFYILANRWLCATG